MSNIDSRDCSKICSLDKAYLTHKLLYSFFIFFVCIQDITPIRAKKTKYTDGNIIKNNISFYCECCS